MGFLKSSSAFLIGFLSGFRVNQIEQRPISRKHFFLKIVYLLSLVYCFYQAISWQEQIIRDHFLVSFFSGFGIGLKLEVATLTISAGLFVLYIIGVVFICFRDSSVEMHWASFPNIGDACITCAFALFVYAYTYDMFYFFGNHCVATSTLCVNFSNTAHTFAISSAGIYLLRSYFIFRPEETGTKIFFGHEIRKIYGTGSYLIPTIPVPHFIYICMISVWDIIPFFWFMYHHPDGRESAQELHVRRR